MSPMTIPRASEPARAAFQKLVPTDPAVTMRPMFGNLSAFVNGNMFSGLFGDELFVRVSDGDQAKIRKQGGKAFEVMPGRAMTGYVLLPTGWQKNQGAARDWVMAALAWTKKMPAKTAPSKGIKAKARAARKPASARSR